MEYRGDNAPVWDTKDILFRLAINLVRVTRVVSSLQISERDEVDLRLVRADLMKIANILDPEKADE